MDVVLIEDDAVQAEYLHECLRAAGRSVRRFDEPQAFFHAAATLRPAALVVDWGLPGMNGGQVITRARQLYAHALPIIVITNDRNESVALTALGLDADDFVYKPVSAPVFRARFEAVMRRYRRDRSAGTQLEQPPYRLDRSTHVLTRHGEPIALTPREFDLAWLLFSNTERFLSRAELMAGVWGMQAELNTHTLAQHVYSLRRKLDLAGHGFRLRSVYGAGYRLLTPSAGGAMADDRDDSHGATPG